MIFVIKLFPEITIKSESVRKRMSRQLAKNLRLVLKRFDRSARVHQEWDKLLVSVDDNSEAHTRGVADLLGRIPGIANYSRILVYPLGDLQSIYQHTFAAWAAALTGKTFCVRVKRNGDHPFSSVEVERYVGGELLRNTQASGVNLRNPDVVVRLEVREDSLYVVEQSYPGLGGFPLGCQESVLSLVSGGFDSTLASYLSIKRGLRTHYLFFNLGGAAHELGVKEIAYYLWSRYGSSHRVKFVSVPFEGVVAEILAKVDPSCMGVVLKRMMLRAAGRVAVKAKASALVTGEAVAQVSSQTLTNLAVIDSVSDALVLRPLAFMDKGAIIDQCRAIGAEHFAANIPEYCGVISIKPSAHVRLHKVEAEEARMNMELLDDALVQARVQTIDTVIADVRSGLAQAHVAEEVAPTEVVIDIRHPLEAEFQPLVIKGRTVLSIPFYTLSNEFGRLDKSTQYLLYCGKGVMSQLHAAHLNDQGHANVGVFKPNR